MNGAIQFDNGLHQLQPVREWLAGQFDILVSLLAAFAESDNRMEADDVPIEDGR